MTTENGERDNRNWGWRTFPLEPVHLVVERAKEGGFKITSPQIPELATAGNTLREAVGNLQDALAEADERRWVSKNGVGDPWRDSGPDSGRGRDR